MNQGRFVGPGHMDRLDVDKIQARLTTSRVGRSLWVYESTASTNDLAWQFPHKTDHDGLCILSEHQTAGRGRGSNRWLSRPGEGLLASILRVDCRYPVELATVATAIAAADAIAAVTDLYPRIKWPNDILLNGRKVCGILIEARTRGKHRDIVIGIGVNCHQAESFFTEEGLDIPATSLDRESGGTVDRNRLAACLLNSLESQMDLAVREGAAVVERWKQYSNQLGLHLTLIFRQKSYSGTCIGIDPAHGLILQLDGGGVRSFDAAHTALVRQIESGSV
ncbi:MAG: biotin--[acetyl-CoA-carboxylase] ligase [Phycisphaerae bacterium]|nr:biotin--[acetyl-CoA-carboxylase] ligase [Phycisphaerae bacterium]